MDSTEESKEKKQKVSNEQGCRQVKYFNDGVGHYVTFFF